MPSLTPALSSSSFLRLMGIPTLAASLVAMNFGCSEAPVPGSSPPKAGSEGENQTFQPETDNEPSLGIDNLEVAGLGGAILPDAPVGNGNAEICDGLDNDEDGNIDNVDQGMDGICDCLNIGTLGHIGPWSSGGDIFKGWLNARSPVAARELGDNEITPELLLGLDVLVVLRVDTAVSTGDGSPAHHAFSISEAEALAAWVRAGGGLMSTVGYQTDEALEIVNVNRLLAPLGLGYDTVNLELTGFLTNWTPDHPLSLGISNIKVENGAAPLTSGTVVARDQDGRAGVVGAQVDEGRVIVFGDEWITYDSEWQDTADQQVELLWLNMLKWMSPPEKCQVAIPPHVVR